ncbi:Uncharacterized protein PCOAH_00039410 [Plasmodium coatneyi]|uniref:V-type proton ATPase subunit S1/VOA1 transmembrane domain-containing protein n=1 Tax=Plasmodium coatneyi TaxID=208452 RepID=A0A1B1E5P9_9APIC|nr:Uncharacterized protein PCOAH_00039410 [Plasmodium coatneyi]ANQ10331.1 Uncharacterized protein PCOAH_00039410 [Plasmodium coatneyi]
MRRLFFVLLSLLCFLLHYVQCDVIIVDSNEAIQGFDKETVLNLSDNVFNIFLDTKTKNVDILSTYANIYNKSNVVINDNCAYVKDLIKGRNLKYLDEVETVEYTKSKETNNFSIYVYTVNGQPDIIPLIYQKHPKYISYIITCQETDIFDNPEDAKQNKNVFHTSPSILSQLIVIFLIFFFLYIGFYVLMNISTPKIFEDKQLIINKEH